MRRPVDVHLGVIDVRSFEYLAHHRAPDTAQHRANLLLDRDKVDLAKRPSPKFLAKLTDASLRHAQTLPFARPPRRWCVHAACIATSAPQEEHRICEQLTNSYRAKIIVKREWICTLANSE